MSYSSESSFSLKRTNSDFAHFLCLNQQILQISTIVTGMPNDCFGLAQCFAVVSNFHVLLMTDYFVT